MQNVWSRVFFGSNFETGPRFTGIRQSSNSQVCLTFSSPVSCQRYVTVFFIFSLLISFVADPTQESWKGYLYAFILTITAMLQTLFLGQYFQRMFVIGMQIRTSIVSSVYRKVRYSSYDPYTCFNFLTWFLCFI